jgi:hypothetical protein
MKWTLSKAMVRSASIFTGFSGRRSTGVFRMSAKILSDTSASR